MLTEKHHTGGFLISEADGHYSRDNVTLDASATTTTAGLESGTVLGKITGTGKYAAYDQQGSGGVEGAAAILYSPADPTGADQAVSVICRAAEVNGNELVWPGGSPTDVTAGVADLRAIGVIVRY